MGTESTIAESAVIYDLTFLGEHCVVQEMVILGVAPPGSRTGELETRIGPYALIRSHTVIYLQAMISAPICRLVMGL
jgi:acyl-[acyl carrier protein]--UDP-N-acetylglucosamine O-acyltransferase